MKLELRSSVGHFYATRGALKPLKNKEHVTVCDKIPIILQGVTADGS